MVDLKRVVLGACFACLAVATGTVAVFAQEDNPVAECVAHSLRREQPVSFFCRVANGLDADRPFTIEETGTFEGQTRYSCEVHSSFWSAERVARFLVCDKKAAFKESPPPEGEKDNWMLFEKEQALRRDAFYGVLLLPGEFLGDAGTYTKSYTSIGTREAGEEQVAQGYQGRIPEGKVHSLLRGSGFVKREEEEIQAVGGEVTFWVGEQDSLLRSVEFVVQVELRVKEQADPHAAAGGPGAGGTGPKWEPGKVGAGSAGDAGDSGGMAGGGTAGKPGEEVVTRQLIVLLVLDVTPASPPARIEPDPEAAELVGW